MKQTPSLFEFNTLGQKVCGIELNQYSTIRFELFSKFIFSSLLSPYLTIYSLITILNEIDELIDSDILKICQLIERQTPGQFTQIQLNYIANKISEWENNIAKLSESDWDTIFRECPKLIEFFPGKNENNPKRLAEIVSIKVKGQDNAVKKLALFLYEWALFWSAKERLFVDYPKPPTSRIIIGKTGSGKTYMIDTFSKALSAGVIKIDASKLVGEGIVGLKLSTEIVDQFNALPEEIKTSGRIIVFIDEFDKLSYRFNNDLDFKGPAVLNELLVLLDHKTSQIRATNSYNKDKSDVINFNIDTFCFILSGAFTGIRSSEKKPMGFLPKIEQNPITCLDIVNFGFPKEVIGRIGSIIELQPISRETLIDILLNSPDSSYKYYQEFFKKNGVNLQLTKNQISEIADLAFAEQLGVRALNKVLIDYLQEKIMSLFF